MIIICDNIIILFFLPPSNPTKNLKTQKNHLTYRFNSKWFIFISLLTFTYNKLIFASSKNEENPQSLISYLKIRRKLVKDATFLGACRLVTLTPKGH